MLWARPTGISDAAEVHGADAAFQLTPTFRALAQILSPTGQKETSGWRSEHPDTQASWAQPREGLCCGDQGDLLPGGWGRGSWAGTVSCLQPPSPHTWELLLCLRAGLRDERRWQRSGWPGTSPPSGPGEPQSDPLQRVGLDTCIPWAVFEALDAPGPGGRGPFRAERPGAWHVLLEAPSPTWLSCPELGHRTCSGGAPTRLSLEPHMLPFQSPRRLGGATHTPKHLRAGGGRGALLLGRVQRGRDVSVPESQSFVTEFVSPRRVPNPKLPRSSPQPLGCRCRLI